MGTAKGTGPVEGAAAESAAAQEGVTCQVCGEAITAEAVYCAACRTPHHRDCWVYSSRCSTFGCGSRLCTDSPLDTAPEGDVLVIEGDDLVAAGPDEDGRLIPPPGSGTNLAMPVTRLDLDTPLEVTLIILITVAVLGTFVALVNGAFAAALGVVLLGSVLVQVYRTTDCTYLVDNTKRSVDYYRRFLGFVRRYDVCAFQEVHAVAIRSEYCSSKHGTWWEYGVALVLADGRVVAATNTWREDLARADALASQLARHFGCQYVTGVPERYLRVWRDKGGGVRVGYEPYSVMQHALLPLAKVGLVVLTLLVGLSAVVFLLM